MKNKHSGPFDPSSLERAAAALRELNQSPHAQKALDAMIKSDEAKRAEQDAISKGRQLDKVKVENQERRLNMEKQRDVSKQVAEHNDKLERQRWKDKFREQEESQDRIRKENEQSLQRQEEIRRETIAFQIKKQTESDEKKLRVKSQLEADNYRKNFDLHTKDTQLKGIQERETKQLLHSMYVNAFKDGAQYLLLNKQAVWTFAKYTFGISFAFFLSKYGLNVGFRQIERRFNTPKLVRETSRIGLTKFYKLPMQLFRQRYQSQASKTKEIFEKIILNNDLEQSLITLSSGILNKQQHKAPLRNLLFYGPPGTGKTLFAKLLAQHSGLHYAIVSGGDIEKLGTQAAGEIDKLFDWTKSTKGTIIFIDEAESVFYKRDKFANTTTNAIATLLSQTSAPSHNFQLVLATNLPQKLDRAIMDRLDSVIEFGYQESPQRKRMIEKGLQRICQPIGLQPPNLHYLYKRAQRILQPSFLFWKPIDIQHKLSLEYIDSLVEQLDTFSGRQIDKFILALHDEAFSKCKKDEYISVLTEQDANKVLSTALKEKQVREQWIKQ